jgi:hypothetical protein
MVIKYTAKLILSLTLLFLLQLSKSKAQFSTPTIDANNDGIGVYPNNYVSGSSTWYMTWDNTNLSVFLQNANQTEPITIYMDVDPMVPVNGGTDANGTLIGLNYDNYTTPPNLPFRADVCIYAHNGYREIFRRNGTNGWTSLGGGNDGICGGGTDDYAGNANGQYSSNDNGNGSGGDDRREFKISWSRLQGAINGGFRPAAFNWMGYVAYNNGMYAQVPVENYNGSSVSSFPNSIVRYFTVLNTGNGTSTNPFSLNSYTQPLTVTTAGFGAISVWDFTMNSNAQTITRAAGAGGVWNIGGSLVLADGSILFGSSSDAANVGNVDISGGTLTLSSSIGGDLNISQNFIKSNGAFNCNLRQVQFNGATAQSFTSNTSESINFFLNSNISSSLTINSNINIPLAGNSVVFAANSNTIIAAGAVLDILTNTTTVTANNAGSLITVNGTIRNRGIINSTTTNLIFSGTGLYEHNWTNTTGVIPTATWNTGSTCSIIGYNAAITVGAGNGYNQAFNNFTWNCTNQAATVSNMAGFLTNIGGNFNVLSTGTTGQLSLATALATINVGGDFNFSGGIVTLGSTTANILNIAGNMNLLGGTFSAATTGAATINLIGNYTQSGGAFNYGTTSNVNFNIGGNFNQSSGVINMSSTTGVSFLNVAGSFTQTGGTLNKAISTSVVGTVQFNGSSNQNINITTPSNITNSICFRLNNAAGITVINGSTIPINSAGIFRRTSGAVTLVGTGVIAYNAINSRLTYDGNTDVNTANEEWPALNGPVNVTLAHSTLSNISLHASRTLPNSGILTINANNRLLLGSNNLTISNTVIGAIAGTFGTNAMIVADGTGQLIRAVTTAIAYTWPIGDMVGTIEYSPVTVNFSASSIARDIGFNVINTTHPQINNPDPQAHYRNRYFGVYNSAAGTYTYTATFTYLAADNVGTVANIKLNAYDGSSWIQAPQTNSAATTSTTAIAVNESTFPLVTGYEIVGRSKPQIYVWNESTGGTQSWAVAANWTPARNVISFDDILQFSNGGTSTANAIPIQTIGKIIMSNNTSVVLVPAVAATLTLSGGVGDDMVVPSGCNLTIGSAPAVVALSIAHAVGSGNTVAINGTVTTGANLVTNGFITANSTVNIDGTFNSNGVFNTTSSTTTVNGTFNHLNGTITSAAANFIFGPTSNYNHNRNGGAIPTANWNLTSNCNINGITSTSPTGLTQNFGNFIWNATAQSAGLVMGANAFTNVLGNLSFLSTNNQALNISSTASALNVGGNLNIDVGAGLIRLNSTNVAFNLNLSGNLALTSGTFTRLAGAAIVSTNFVNPSAVQSFIQTSGICAGIMNWNVGTSVTTNTLQLLSNIDLGGAASPFTVNQNAALDCGTFIISGSSAAFTLSNTAPGATLITANPDGIELTGTIGSIQTTGSRIYSANSNYIFNAVVAQNTGLGFTAANNLTIDNNANVSLSTNAVVSGITTFSNGKIILNSSNLSILNSAASPFVGNTTARYIVTNGAGEVIRNIATIGLPINYSFPVGDALNYSPVELNFSTNSISRNIGVVVTAGPVPFNLPSTDYINRSWAFSNNAAGTYTYIPTFTYAVADVVGTPTNMKISRYVGPLWTEFNATPNTIVAPPEMTLTGSLTESTGPLSSYWTGRLYAPAVSYTWNGSTSSDWNTATNWTPNGIPGIIDNVTINSAAINPCVANGAFFGVNNFTLNATGNFQLAANSTLTINGNYTYASPAIASFNCSSTLNISSPLSQNVYALNYGNLNLSGGNRVLAAAGTIRICGQYSTGAGAITITGSTIEYNGPGPQTITSTSYNNLTISQNRGGGLITLEPGTITVNALFIPSLSNFTAFVDGNTFHFNGAAGQIIPAFFYFNITSANAARTWANAGIIDVKGSFIPPTTGNTITGSTIRFSSTLPGINLATYTTNVTNRNFNNVVFDGVGGSWSAGTANLRPNGTLVVNNGTVNVATSVAGILAVNGTTTINGGVLNLSSNIGVGTGTFTGTVTVNGGQLNLANGSTAAGTASATAPAINVNGGFFVVSNSAAPGTLDISNVLTINGGTFRMTTGAGAATVTTTSNLVQTSGSFVRAGSGVSSFVFNGGFGGIRNWTQGATFTMTGVTTFSVAGTFATLRILSNVNIGNAAININSGFFFDSQTFVLSGTTSSAFRVFNGGRYRTQHPDGVNLAPAATGSVQTATRFFGGSCLWWFEGAVPQRTGTAFPGSVDQLNISNGTNGFTLDVTVRIQNSISWSGNIILGNNNLHIGYYNPVGPVNYTPSFTGSASKFVITNGTGMLVKYFSGSSGTFNYPIGDNSGLTEYSPVSLTISSLSGGRDSIGFRVTNTQHPNDFSVTNHLNRFWTCGAISSANYNYTATFTYQTADIVGVESVLKVDRWSNPLNTWTQDAGSSVNVAANTLTTSALNQTNGTLLNNDFASRSDAPFYYQTVASGPWSDINTWEISTDPLFLSPLPVPAGVAPDANNSVGITIKNAHNVTVTAPANADEMTINTGGTLTVNASQTFTIANGIGTDLIVNGTINNLGLITTSGALEFNAGATYSHAQNAGTVPTATWNTGSTCEITGITNTSPAGLNQTFYDFEWNCTAQSTPIQLSGSLTSINNNFSVISTGSPTNDLRVFDNSSVGTLNIGSNLNISGGVLALINSASNGAGIATVNVNGNLSISSGGIDMSGSSLNTANGANLNIMGDVVISGTGSIIRSQNITAVVTLNKSSGIQLFSVAPNSINASNILWRVGNGLSTNVVNFSSNIAINALANFRVMSNATLNCGQFVLTGGNFENQLSSTLGIGAINGITLAPAASGNIQTTTRTYLGNANYTYNGILSQSTGNGLPTTLTGNLNINNSGGFGTNFVTLTTTGTTGSALILTSGIFAIGNTQQFNISNTGIVNAIAGDFASGTSGGTLNFVAAGSFSGNCNPFNVTVNGAVNFGAGNVNIQNGGTLQMNAGSSVVANAALYSTNSTLIYNINGNFNRGLEWSAGSGKGYPYHVRLTNNTVLNAAGAAAVNAAVSFATAGNLTIDAGASLAMNFSGNNMTVPLTVAGNIDFTGSLIASGSTGGDIALAGNWINNGVASINFSPNNRVVTFNGTLAQSITGTNSTINPFANLTINNPNGVSLSTLNAVVQNGLTLLNGKFNLNNLMLTLGSNANNGTLIGGSATAYIISGSSSAKFVRYTTTNATTYNFPVGDLSNYTPMSVQFFSSPMAPNTQLEVSVTPASHPNLGTSTNYLSRYWSVEPVNLPNPLTDYAVTYEYANADVVGVEANLKPFKYSTVGWIAAQGSGATFEMGTGSVNPGTNTITWTGLNNFSDFTGNGNGSPLPISLINFDAQVVLDQVEVVWTTATEINNDYFTIERSKDGIEFKALAQINGAGNSNQHLNYKLMDEKPYQGISYYRLKQTDFDGKFSYSQVKSVKLNSSLNKLIDVYPNPSNLNGVYISHLNNDSQFNVQLFDIYGKLILSFNKLKASGDAIFIDFGNVPSGIYTISITQQDGSSNSQRISIIR